MKAILKESVQSIQTPKPNLTEYEKKVKDIIEAVKNVQNYQKPKIRTPDRNDLVRMYTANDLALSVATGLVHLTQSIYQIFNHPKYVDQVERSPDMIKEMHEIFVYTILPALHDNITEMIEATHYNDFAFTKTKREIKSALQEPLDLRSHCQKSVEFFQDYRIQIEEFYELTGRKVIHSFVDVILMHLLPKWQKIVEQEGAGKLKNYELQFAHNLKVTALEFCTHRDKERHAEERILTAKNLGEL